jgi:Flp pilus assembly protein TadB
MTTVLLYLALATLFGSVAMLAYALMPGGRAVAVRGMALKQAELERLPGWLKALFPLLDGLAPLARRIRWPTYREHAVTQLQRAGIAEALTVDHLLVLKVVSAAILPLLGAQIFALLRNPAIFLLAVFGAFILPDRLVADLRKKREKQIVRALPGAVDVLSLSVEAGLEFLLALQRQVERGTPGPRRDARDFVVRLRARAGRRARRLDRARAQVAGRAHADRALPAGRARRREGLAEDPVSAGLLHLPRRADRDSGSGGAAVHLCPVARPACTCESPAATGTWPAPSWRTRRSGG